MREQVTGLVLAGGRATRMGGVDKGLVPLAGRPLVDHVLERLRPQVGRVLINANRHHARYQAFGHPVIADADQSRAGPLAGMLAGLSHVSTPWLVTVPCDSPLCPTDLVRRLLEAALADGRRVAVATAGGRPQPVFCLLHRDCRDALHAWLAGSGRKVMPWLHAEGAVEVAFDSDADAFLNINTEDERQLLESRLSARADGTDADTVLR